MSHTSESLPPSLGAMGRYSFVFESKTATFETLASCWPSRCSTLEKRPPSQMLVPTCSIALTRPSTIGVSSGVSEGNARAVPDSVSIVISMAATANSTDNFPFFIRPYLPWLWGGGKEGTAPNRVQRLQRNPGSI
jgi:hypothetical protein